VDGAVGIRRGLAHVKDLFGLAVHMQPEVAVDDVRHGQARMRVPAGPGAGGDVDRGDDELQVGAGNIGALQDRALGDSTTPSVISAVYNAMLLSTVRSSHDSVAFAASDVERRGAPAVDRRGERTTTRVSAGERGCRVRGA